MSSNISWGINIKGWGGGLDHNLKVNPIDGNCHSTPNVECRHQFRIAHHTGDIFKQVWSFNCSLENVPGFDIKTPIQDINELFDFLAHSWFGNYNVAILMQKVGYLTSWHAITYTCLQDRNALTMWCSFSHRLSTKTAIIQPTKELQHVRVHLNLWTAR